MPQDGHASLYGVLADITVIAHLGWILFLMFGALVGRRYRVVRWAHLAGLAFAVPLTAFGWICPLTHLEVWLRERARDGGAYRGTFIGHYAERLVYLEVPRWWVMAGTAAVVVVSLAAYLWPRRAR